MPPDQKGVFFIDTHCHMFTIADIPLYHSIRQILEDNDRTWTYLAFPLIPFIRPFYDPHKALNHFAPFIKYFELEPEQAVEKLAREVSQALSGAAFQPYADNLRQVVLTPLMMDFDETGQVVKLTGQVNRLLEAIKNQQEKIAGNLKVLPFLGLCPERPNIPDLMEAFRLKSVQERGGYESCANGDMIGIKLYPPLGFKVNPEYDKHKRHKYLTFYRELAQRGLPVTTHCQKSSFSFTDRKEREAFTAPMNWEDVFQELTEEERNNFRINFAHFGGDDEVYATIVYERVVTTDAKLYEEAFHHVSNKTWTYSIIRLLKRYRHTYSDLGAFNFDFSEALASLYWLLYLDETGAFKELGDFKLIDKLLWGSDYPMTLNKRQRGYEEILDKFVAACQFTPHTDGRVEYPPLDKLPAPAEVIKKLVCDNPQKFLF